MAYRLTFGDADGDLDIMPSIEQSNGFEHGEETQFRVRSDIMDDITSQLLEEDAQQNKAEESSRARKTGGKGKGKKKEKQAVAFTNGGPSKEGLGSHRIDKGYAPETEDTATRSTKGRGNTRSIVRIGEPEEDHDVVNGDDDDENDDTNIDSQPGVLMPIKQEAPVKSLGSGRGRPSRNPAIKSKSTVANGSSAKKRKRLELETGPSQRPTRAAAESARSTMAEQSASKRSKSTAVASPATKPKVKAKAKTNGASPVTRRGRKGRKADTSNCEYVVEKIVNSRLNKKKGVIEYSVKWQGYAASENTWEPAENLEHCPKMLAQYTKSQKSK